MVGAARSTYGMGYRMCAGSMLANRELYLVFIRMINTFEIQEFDSVDCHPVTGASEPCVDAEGIQGQICAAEH